MMLPIGSLLDDGIQGVAQAVVAASIVLAALLVAAIFLPLVILTSLLRPAISGPAQLLTLVANVVPVRSEAPAAAPASSADARATAQPGPPAGAGESAVDAARRYLGVQYVFGGTNPAVGLDCSGLVQLVFHDLGMRLPRTAQQQYSATARVPPDQLQPGDLVFFARTYADPNDWITHVGIYIGNGQQINAPTEGQVVSVQPVFTGFWGAHFVSGGRVSH
jgi:cell wall-associated NlpC family hydrolase